MSVKRVSEQAPWIQVKDLNRGELEALKEILPFYVINTPYESYSFRGIPVTMYGWPANVWNTNDLKEPLFHVANLSVGQHLFHVGRLEDMSDMLELAHMNDDFFQHREHEKIVVYVNSHDNLLLSIFKNIRNSLAHGRFVMYPVGDDFMMVMESVDKSGQSFVVKARMILRVSTLLAWKNIITKGPVDVAKRKRKKK